MAGESNRLIYLFWLDNATLGGQWSPFFFLFFCPVPEDELILGEDDEKKKKKGSKDQKKNGELVTGHGLLALSSSYCWIVRWAGKFPDRQRCSSIYFLSRPGRESRWLVS